MAFKIFELGLKKYGDIPEYILAYIDYLSHLNGTSALHPHITVNDDIDHSAHVTFNTIYISYRLCGVKSGLKQGRVACR